MILHSHIDSTEILIINVDDNTSYTHGIIDIPLLNATAVSDLKKNFTEKANHEIISAGAQNHQVKLATML